MTRTARRPSFPDKIRFAAAWLLVEVAIRIMPQRYHERVDQRMLEAVAQQKGMELRPSRAPEPTWSDHE